MTFLSPWMLAGAGAVGIPIALHFFYKARYQRLPWAAMDFLKEAIEQTSRRLKFQEWILLALRCLVILLLALALARPGKDSAGGGRGDAVDAVLVFDTSYSMGADDGDGKSRLDRAKEAALGVIESLPPKSTVQIVLCGDRAENVGPKSRSNLDQARQLIPTIQTTGLSSDLLPGFAAAQAAVDSGTAPVKEVYLFGDLQKLGFERQQGALRDRCDELRAKTNLVFIRCGKEDRKVSNVAVTDVTAVGTIPHTRTRVPFVVSVKNTGSATIKGIKVGLELGGKSVQDVTQVPSIEPGQVEPVTLTGSLDEAGPQVLTVRVSGDQLPGDNRFDRVIVVREAIRVLLVDGNPNPAMPVESASHFVRTALTPVAQDRTEEYFVRPAVAAVNEVGPGMLANFDVVYLLNAPAAGTAADPRGGLPADFVARLREFVAAGGGLVIGGGEQVVPADYNRVLGSGGAGLLPFDLAGEPANATETAPFVPAPESVEVPSFLAAFKERPFSDALRGVTATKMHPLTTDGPGAAGGRVLVRTGDGKPFVTSRVVGEGEVVFVATTLDERWTNFPGRASDAFVPFTQYTLAHLTARKVPGGTRTAGDPLVWHPPEADGLFDLVKPPRQGEKEPRRVRLDKARPDAAGKLTLTAADTADPGLYRIVAEGKPDATGPVFAVNPDLRESANLDVASAADLSKLLGFEPAVIQAGAGTEAAVTQHRARQEWTEYVLLLLLLAAVAESAWAWVCGRAW